MIFLGVNLLEHVYEGEENSVGLPSGALVNREHKVTILGYPCRGDSARYIVVVTCGINPGYPRMQGYQLTDKASGAHFEHKTTLFKQTKTTRKNLH